MSDNSHPDSDFSLQSNLFQQLLRLCFIKVKSA